MKFTNKWTASKKGFTLIEMLVVVAIIGVLAAILFPVFARARENARRANCMSNLKQIGLAVLQYTQDYDERMPGLSNTSVPPTYWFNMIEPYTKSTQLFFCPSDAEAKASEPLTTANIAYGWNDYYLATNYDMGDMSGSSLASFEHVAQTILAGDSNGYTFTSGVNAGKPRQRYVIRNSGGYQPVPRHFDGDNFVFMDGHVKWFKLPGMILNDATLWDRH